MPNTSRQVTHNLFYNYKWSLIILAITIVSGIILYISSHNWKYITALLSISVPLLVLFIKTERDEANLRNTRTLISRNFLLAYLLELDDINKRFNKLRTNKPTPDINDLSNIISDYDDIVENKEDINMLIESSLKNIDVIEQRQTVHNDFKELLNSMLKTNDLIYTDDEYNMFREIQFAYLWMNDIDIPELKDSLGNFKVSCGAYLNKDGMHLSGGETVIPKEWESFKKEATILNNRIELDNLINNSLNKLINTLDIYDPNSKNVHKKKSKQ